MAKTHKQRDNYKTGLKECFATCKCIQCRKKKEKKEKVVKPSPKSSS